MLNISEKDLYLFVFYPENLSKDKIEFIQLNYERFATELELLKDMQENIKMDVDGSILDKIHSKISENSVYQKVTLEKIILNNSNEYLVLAAESPSHQTFNKTDTFKDGKNQFLCKIISTEKNNKIYIFHNSSENLSEFRITLLPSNETYNMDSKNMPLIIEPRQMIEKLELNFQHQAL